jgi:hypothetical protein
MRLGGCSGGRTCGLHGKPSGPACKARQAAGQHPREAPGGEPNHRSSDHGWWMSCRPKTQRVGCWRQSTRPFLTNSLEVGLRGLLWTTRYQTQRPCCGWRAPPSRLLASTPQTTRRGTVSRSRCSAEWGSASRRHVRRFQRCRTGCVSRSLQASTKTESPTGTAGAEAAARFMSKGKQGGDRFLRGRPTRQLLQVCPTCLEEDEAKLGAPYFHRSHQLLGTRVCHKHGGNLMRQCPGCGASVGLASGMVLAAMNCGCGAKLWKARAGQPESPAWLLLAQFEHKALHAVTGQLAADRLIVALRGVLADKYPGPGRSSGVRALRTFFGDEGANWIQRSVVNPDRDEGSSDTPIALKDANALVLSGLSVAAGWTIETAVAAALASAKVPSTAAVEPSLGEVALSLRQKRPDNATEARRQIDLYLERLETPSWKRVRQGKTFAFWLLAVRDLEWLANRLGPKPGVTGLPAFPSVSEDRTTLERDADLALQNKLPGRISCEAAMRAYYRDRTWLDAQVLACEQERKEEEVSTLRELLQAASDRWRSRPGKPLRFSLQSAAAELGWTMMVLKRRMQVASLSTDQVVETTPEFQERLIRWAIDERLRRSKSLAPSMVCLEAELSTTQNR